MRRECRKYQCKTDLEPVHVVVERPLIGEARLTYGTLVAFEPSMARDVVVPVTRSLEHDVTVLTLVLGLTSVYPGNVAL